MNKLTELWIKVTKEKEVEEYAEEVQELYDYTIQLQQKVNQLETNRDEAIECIKEFLCTEEYIKVDGIAIANNYMEALEILERGKE